MFLFLKVYKLRTQNMVQYVGSWKDCFQDLASLNPDLQPWISFILSSTQFETEHIVETKQLHPKHLTQVSRKHPHFSEVAQASFIS